MLGDNFRDLAAATLRVPCRTAGTTTSVNRAIYGPSLPYLLDSLVLQHGGKKEKTLTLGNLGSKRLFFVLMKKVNRNRRRTKIA
jgi:hypothetical protein